MLALACDAVQAEGFWSKFVDPDDSRLDASSFLADSAYGFLPMPIIVTDPAVERHGVSRFANTRRLK